MKRFEKWRKGILYATILILIALIFEIIRKDYIAAIITFVGSAILIFIFFKFWSAVNNEGVQTEFDISRVLGKNAKDALSFGGVGILTYDDDYVITWASPMFQERGMDLVHLRLTSWIENIGTLFDDEVDVVVGEYEDHVYEITRKADASLLYVRDITECYRLHQAYDNNQIVIGVMTLDNYMDYQSCEDEETMARINTHLRGRLVTWARENGMFIRRTRSDRFLIVLNQEILKNLRMQNMMILQEIKDKAKELDVTITLSMAFAYGSPQFLVLDEMVNELIESTQLRGGDQAAIRCAGGSTQYIGGGFEGSSSRSKVRVRALAQSIQDSIQDSDKVFIAGHINTDFDCMGAALGIASLATSLHTDAYIVLEGVPRDNQLQEIMNRYKDTLEHRYVFITPEMAKSQMDFKNDLLIMVDHGVPFISSAKDFVGDCSRVIVIDHHRKGDNFVRNPMLTYVESTASSSCEMITELLQSISTHIPIYEVEATIMYLGILVDTNRFKMHTDARTFEAAGALRAWGANNKLAEKALQEDYKRIQLRNRIVGSAKIVYNKIMVASVEECLDKTMVSQVSDALLMIKGACASFTIAYTTPSKDVVSVSARGDGNTNVQRILEKMQGGGHFSAAAVDRKNVTVKEIENELLNIIKEEYNEGNFA